ncbi:MAG: hypothetical protein IJ191_06815 [Treponema sp.]|nr:hypothetical protein [Treponema sp.]
MMSISAAYAYNFDPTVVTEIYHFREQLYTAGTVQDYKKAVHDFIEDMEQRHLPEQEQHTVKNIAAVELVNFVDDGMDKKERYLMLNERQYECDRYMKQQTDVSEWFLVSYADVKSRLVSYISGGTAYTISMDAYSLYQAALKINKKFAYGYVGYALWLFFAPPIAGGGYDAARKTYAKALQYAANDFDRYVALIYRSQVYYAIGKKKEYETDLTQARALYTEERLTEYVRKKNEAGMSFFD